MQPKIFTLTLNPCLDRYVSVTELHVNSTIRGDLISTKIGGKGITVSRVLQKLGMESKIITVLGGCIGEELRQKLTKEDLNCEIIESSIETRVCTNFLTSDNKNYKINEKGGVQSLETQYKVLETVRKYLEKDQIWVLGGILPLGFDINFYFQLINLIQSSGSRAILDSSGDNLAEGLKAKPFLIKPNIHETENYLGMKIENVEIAKKAVQKYLNIGICFVVQSLGSNGLVFGYNNETNHIAGNKVNANNLIGAGDSLVAGLVFGLVQGWDIDMIAEFGVRVSSGYVQSEDLNEFKKFILP
jgi:1-phosphofructokinase